MNDIPAFAEAGGVSTLILREIPYKKTAFVMVRIFDRQSLDEHLQEAVSLCRFAGAKAVYAAAESEVLFPEREPDYKMLRLGADCCCETVTEQEFEALCESNLQDYTWIYNACFADIVSAETLTEKKVRTNMENPGRQCLVYYKDGKPAAISDVEFAEGAALLNAVAVLPEYRGGFGQNVLKNIMADTVKQGVKRLCVNVMSTNGRALKLYERMGFETESELSCWFRLL